MRIYGSCDTAPLSDRRPAVTLGMFDGVHLGHRAIIGELMRLAGSRGIPGLAMTFSNHPRTALGRSAPPAICSLEMRLKLLAETGLDAVWVLPFTAEFAATPGRDFAEEFFRRRLNAGAVALGESAVFGRRREGNAATLREWAREWDCPVVAVPPLAIEGSVVSSTAIRLAVRNGLLRRAERFLGRKVSVEGTVVHGQGRGRALGFPTLNIDPHHELRPPPGVYLTRTHVAGGDFPSVTNIGRPPTETEIAAGLGDFLIETHLLDFEGDLYDRTAEVVFYHKTRDVMHFASPADLRAQVMRDLASAREWFADSGNA